MKSISLYCSAIVLATGCNASQWLPKFLIANSDVRSPSSILLVQEASEATQLQRTFEVEAGLDFILLGAVWNNLTDLQQLPVRIIDREGNVIKQISTDTKIFKLGTLWISCEAILAEGSDLPSWLSFDAETQIFSGTPSNDDVGSYNCVITLK